MDIVATNVSYTYGMGTPFEHQALRNVNFHIPSGSFTGIIGHTGSGKSTLIQQFNGLLRPTEGVLTVGNTHVTASAKGLNALRRQVGIVFQYPEHQLFEETVAKDVAFGPRNLNLRPEEVERRVRQALAQVGLSYEQVAEKSPFHLSGGQKRRVAIAGVLAMEPQVLVLDEPTAGLDPRGKREILNMIVQLQRVRKLTVVIVSHDMEDVARLADHLLVLHRGTVVVEGPPGRVFREEEQLKACGLDLPSMLRFVQRVNRFVQPAIPLEMYSVEQLADALADRWRERARQK